VMYANGRFTLKTSYKITVHSTNPPRPFPLMERGAAQRNNYPRRAPQKSTDRK